MYLTRGEEVFILKLVERNFEKLSSSDKYVANRLKEKFVVSRQRSKATMERYLERRRADKVRKRRKKEADENQ